jgi:hypothetical protein
LAARLAYHPLFDDLNGDGFRNSKLIQGDNPAVVVAIAMLDAIIEQGRLRFLLLFGKQAKLILGEV